MRDKSKLGPFNRQIDLKTYREILETTRHIKPGEKFNLSSYYEFNSDDKFHQTNFSLLGTKEARKDLDYLMTFRRAPRESLSSLAQSSSSSPSRNYNFEAVSGNGRLGEYYRYDYNSSADDDPLLQPPPPDTHRSSIEVHNKRLVRLLHQ